MRIVSRLARLSALASAGVLLLSSVVALAQAPTSRTGSDSRGPDPRGQDGRQFPEWIPRVWLDGSFEEDTRKVRGAVEAVQPLLKTEQSTWFLQGRTAYQQDDWTFNAGLGYRYLLADKSLLLGLSGWHDWTSNIGHRRWGLGAEAMGTLLTWRGNYYNGYTGWRLVEDAPTFRIEERAMSGFDTEIELPVPYMPWLRLASGYYYWDAKESKDVHGYSGRLQMDVTRHLRVESSLYADNRGTTGLVKLSIALGQARSVPHTLADTGLTSATAFAPRNLEDERLERVRRNHTVVVERRTINKAAGGAVSGSIIIGRGT